jgi:beta-mannosidase
MDLSGTWRAALADDDLRRTAVGLDFDDSGWEPITVPGHWRSTAAFAASDGPLIYRRRFELDRPTDGQRCFAVLDGLFYQGDVWLDGAYLGDPEGYFAPHAYDITELARLATDHVVSVEVTCEPQRDKTAKRAVTGVFQHWDCLDPDWNPGGLWRPVRIETTGPVRIEGLRVLCREASPDRATVDVIATLDSDAGRSVRITTSVDGIVERELEHGLAQGANTVEWSFGIDNPPLWWPWALGPQPLVRVTVTVEAEGEPSHERTVRTGLRQVALDQWRLSVNGERLFVKGANIGPTRMALAEATPEELRRDVLLAKEAGLDLIRVHAHITRPELYDAADELGMLVWQDFPLQWGYHRSIRKQAVRQARQAVDLLGHHPSIALWCGHNEPIALATEPGLAPDLKKVAAAFAVGQAAPFTWNRTVLDRSVKRAFEKADPTRPVVPHSGVAPHLPQLDGTDSHLYFGWYHGDERDLPAFAAAVPRMVRFVSEFGAQAVPNDAGFMEPERWPDLDWERLARTHALQKWVFDDRVPPAAFATFDEWRVTTQGYQALLLRHHVETLRRLKYRPTGGFCMFSLTDAHPAVTWSVLGHDRSAKAGYHALVEACRPVIVVADRLPEAVAGGSKLRLDVHVVSDLRVPLDGAVVTARLSWPDGGGPSWRWQGDVPADACVKVATLETVVPATPGPFHLDLDLACGDVAASNRYDGRLA